MAQGKGAKGQKLGRNTRAPTNAQQKTRTERNKRRHIAKHGDSGEIDYKSYRQGSIMGRAAKRLVNCIALWDMRNARMSH